MHNNRNAMTVLLESGCNAVQVGYSHEGLVEIVQLQNTGQQEETRDQYTGEELGQSKCLQTNRCQPEDNQVEQLRFHYFSFTLAFFVLDEILL